MEKVEIVVHQRQLPRTLAVLQRLAVVHLVDAGTEPELAGRGYAPTQDERAELATMRYLRARLEALAQLVPDLVLPPPQTECPEGGCRPNFLRDELDEVSEEVQRLANRLDALRSEQEVLPRHLHALRRLQPLVPELPSLDRYETVALLLERSSASMVDLLREHLRGLVGDRFELITGSVQGDMLGVVLLFPRDVSEEVHRLLGREQIGQLRLPEGYGHLPFREAVDAMERRLDELPGRIATLREQLATTVREHIELFRARGWLGQRIEQLEALHRLASTDATSVVVGWVPTAERERLERALTGEIGPEVIVEGLADRPGEQPPVLLHNPRVARPFEFLVQMLDVPSYGTIDPTVLMAIFMPLFFGMMLGDVVYGVILLGLSLWLVRRYQERSPVVGDLGRYLVMGSGWTILWGVIYGEYLGDLGRHVLGLQPLWINREEAIAPLLIFSIAVGVGHVLLGILLGIWNAWRVRNGGVIAERVGMLAAMIGLMLLTALAVGQVPGAVMTPAVAALIVGMVLLAHHHGVAGILMGPLEVVSLAGNVLSYLRIAAIGMASAYLARVANELGALGPLWLGVVVATLFHTLNLALGAFSPTIQALRLHYVEFFGKFFEQGGERYRAFGAVDDDDEQPEASPTPRTPTEV